jgi:predicted 3-demethylubiquinone-9 3-methyltransferase (glyoxalase superfamily)
MSTPDGGPETPRSTKADHKAAKAYAKATRPWYKKKRWWAAGLLLIVVIGAAGSGGGTDDSPRTASENTSQDSQSENPAAQEEPAAKEEPEMTPGQENALEAAQNYIDLMGFSKVGLIQQLSSSAGDGYSRADATFAANNVDANWKEEAVEAAKNYLDTMPMSKDALIQQLSSAAGDKFTPAQARYAASKAY